MTAVFVAVGTGGYVTALPAGAKGRRRRFYRIAGLRGPMPTNDWWSSLVWMKFSERQYPHPLAVAAEPKGLRVYYPGATITANKDAIFAFMPEGRDDLVLGHSAVETFPDARGEAFSDWFVTARFGDAGRGMSVSYGHGSPYVYALFDEGGEAKVSVQQAADRLRRFGKVRHARRHGERPALWPLRPDRIDVGGHRAKCP